MEETNERAIGASRPPLSSNDQLWGRERRPGSGDPPRMARPQSIFSMGPLPLGCVELQVANLDQKLDVAELRSLVLEMFRDHVEVLQISFFHKSDGDRVVSVKLRTAQDAQIAISQLHRRKVGSKRIVLSYSQNPGTNIVVLRNKVASLLQEVPSRKLPLFQFREMFEKRYQCSVGLSDLYKMKDMVSVLDEETGRMISLHGRTTLNFASYSQQSTRPNARDDPSFCSLHSSGGNLRGWAEKENDCQLPYVLISLKDLSNNLRVVLEAHNGSLALASLVHCYNAMVNPKLKIDFERGVPLEHLLTGLKGFLIHNGVTDVKTVSLVSGETESLPSHHSNAAISPLQGKLTLFSRDYIELLKSCSCSTMAFSSFVPSYHHHFGRQCRVADYGYTRLRDVLEAVSNTVQILGEGSRCLLTLSHRSQMKRFTNDLLRILKAQTSKSLRLGDFGSVFEAEFGVQFQPRNYGVCHLEDLLNNMTDSSILFSRAEHPEESVVLIYQRKQTPDEIQRTIRFSKEVYELLKQTPNCSLPFTKFIPAYHHNFGRQCRVSDYGFNKLIDLMEAIPDTINVSDNAMGERVIGLVPKEMLKVIGEQLESLLQFLPALSPETLAEAYLNNYGYPLRPENVGAVDLLDLFERFRGDVIEIYVDGDGETLIFLTDARRELNNFSHGAGACSTPNPHGLPSSRFNTSSLNISNDSNNAFSALDDQTDFWSSSLQQSSSYFYEMGSDIWSAPSQLPSPPKAAATPEPSPFGDLPVLPVLRNLGPSSFFSEAGNLSDLSEATLNQELKGNLKRSANESFYSNYYTDEDHTHFSKRSTVPPSNPHIYSRLKYASRSSFASCSPLKRHRSSSPLVPRYTRSDEPLSPTSPLIPESYSPFHLTNEEPSKRVDKSTLEEVAASFNGMGVSKESGDNGEEDDSKSRK